MSECREGKDVACTEIVAMGGLDIIVRDEVWPSVGVGEGIRGRVVGAGRGVVVGERCRCCLWARDGETVGAWGRQVWTGRWYKHPRW